MATPKRCEAVVDGKQCPDPAIDWELNHGGRHILRYCQGHVHSYDYDEYMAMTSAHMGISRFGECPVCGWYPE